MPFKSFVKNPRAIWGFTFVEIFLTFLSVRIRYPDLLKKKYTNIHISAGRSEKMVQIYWSKIIMPHSLKTTHSRLYRKLSQALAGNAEVTVVWIQTVVSRAKQQWQVKSLQQFIKNLQILAVHRGIALHEDIMRIAKNCWLYVSA
jgi:hypothetical protein